MIGANGAGKSTLLKVLSGITEPTTGYAEIRGRVGSLLEVGTGFHPDLSGRNNVYLNGTILGMRRGEIRQRFDEIVEFSGVEAFIDVPVKWYSSGMYVRLAFAVAAHLDPEVLIVDEVLSVGDISFQRKCLGRMDELAHDGRTVLFVSHNLTSVASLCSVGCVLETGQLVAQGPIEQVIEIYVSSMRRESQTLIAERSDRDGTGKLRFVGIDIGRGRAPVSGDDLDVDLLYEAPASLGNVMVGVAVYGVMGEPLFVCSSQLTGEEFTHAPKQGVFRCNIPRLPLAPRLVLGERIRRSKRCDRRLGTERGRVRGARGRLLPKRPTSALESRTIHRCSWLVSRFRGPDSSSRTVTDQPSRVRRVGRTLRRRSSPWASSANRLHVR